MVNGGWWKYKTNQFSNTSQDILTSGITAQPQNFYDVSNLSYANLASNTSDLPSSLPFRSISSPHAVNESTFSLSFQRTWCNTKEIVRFQNVNVSANWSTLDYLTDCNKKGSAKNNTSKLHLPLPSKNHCTIILPGKTFDLSSYFSWRFFFCAPYWFMVWFCLDRPSSFVLQIRNICFIGLEVWVQLWPG